MDERVARVVELLRQGILPLPAELADLLDELGAKITPLDEAEVRNKVRTTALDQAAVRQALALRLDEELPQRDEAQEVGALVAKA